MLNMKKSISKAALIKVSTLCLGVFLASCAGINKNSGEGTATYHESAMNDLNKAPIKFNPPSLESELQNDSNQPVNTRLNADYYFTVGESLALEGNSRKAIEAYKTVLVYDPNSATVHLRLAIETLKAGMVSEAITHCEDALKIDDKRVDVHLLLAGLYSSLKAYDGAIKEYEKVIAIDSNNSEAPLYLGVVYAEKKQYNKALNYFAKLANDEDYANRYIVEYYTGRVYQELKKWRESESAFKKSLEKKPDFYDAALALGNLYETQGKKEKAIELYVKFQRENGPHANLAEALAQIFLGRQEYERAMEQLLLLEELGEDQLNVKVKIALIYVEQKKYPLAVKKFEETLTLAPESDKVRFYLAALYEEMKEEEKALSYYQQVPVDSNFYSESIIHAASILRHQNQLSAAKNTLEKALDTKPENPQMYILYAVIMDSLGDSASAESRIAKGLERFPNQPQILFYLGTIKDKMGMKDEMLKIMKKVIEIDPKHTQAINYLAYSYAEESLNLGQAETLARKAHQLSPEDPFIMDTLGWVLFKQGRVKEAIPWLEAAFNHQPNESVIADHLGDAYINHQLPEKAKEMYQRAMQNESDKSKQKMIEQKLTVIDTNSGGDQRLPASVYDGIKKEDQNRPPY